MRRNRLGHISAIGFDGARDPPRAPMLPQSGWRVLNRPFWEIRQISCNLSLLFPFTLVEWEKPSKPPRKHTSH